MFFNGQNCALFLLLSNFPVFKKQPSGKNRKVSVFSQKAFKLRIDFSAYKHDLKINKTKSNILIRRFLEMCFLFSGGYFDKNNNAYKTASNKYHEQSALIRKLSCTVIGSVFRFFGRWYIFQRRNWIFIP